MKKEMTNQYLHEVAITAIIISAKGGSASLGRSDTGKAGGKDDPSAGLGQARYLITQRSKSKKRFPGMWTVPGGKMETSDYLRLPKDTKHYWYNVLERTLRREVKEEVGINIEHIEYLTSLATVHEDGSPSLVISCVADYKSGKIKLKKDESIKHAWITLKEAKKYKLIDGIYDELVMAENQSKGTRSEWKRF